MQVEHVVGVPTQVAQGLAHWIQNNCVLPWGVLAASGVYPLVQVLQALPLMQEPHCTGQL